MTAEKRKGDRMSLFFLFRQNRRFTPEVDLSKNTSDRTKLQPKLRILLSIRGAVYISANCIMKINSRKKTLNSAASAFIKKLYVFILLDISSVYFNFCFVFIPKYTRD